MKLLLFNAENMLDTLILNTPKSVEKEHMPPPPNWNFGVNKFQISIFFFWSIE